MTNSFLLQETCQSLVKQHMPKKVSFRSYCKSGVLKQSEPASMQIDILVNLRREALTSLYSTIGFDKTLRRDKRLTILRSLLFALRC